MPFSFVVDIKDATASLPMVSYVTLLSFDFVYRKSQSRNKKSILHGQGASNISSLMFAGFHNQ